MRYFLFLAIFFIFIFTARAQQTPLELVKQAFQTAGSHQYISYSAFTTNKNFFDDKDTSFARITETIVRNDFGKIVAQNTIQFNRVNRPVFRDVLIRDSLYTFDLKDSIYSVKAHPRQVSGVLADYLEKLQYLINNKSDKITQSKDTVIGNIRCYSFFIRSYDTVENNNHNYTYVYLNIDKKSLMPVYMKELGAGSAEKGEYSIGRISVFNEKRFEKYIFQKKSDPSVFKFDLSGFDPENKTMLEEGSIAPEIQVRDLSGKSVPMSFFQNKIVLLEFGSTTCPANFLTQPLLTKLSNKYRPDDVAIVCIYSDETSEQVRSYIEANHIGTPIYLGSIKLKKQFKTISVPNFYLISRKGIVIKALEGYSNKLEEELITAIDHLKEK